MNLPKATRYKVKSQGAMGFELRVNGRNSVRAVLPGEGVLVFHVAVERAIASEPADQTVTIYGSDLYELDITGSRFMRWANIKVALGDRISLRFVTGGTSSPRPRVRSVDNVMTRFGLTERLRGLKRELAEVERKLTLSEPELRKQGLRDLKRIQAKTRGNLAAVNPKGPRRRTGRA